MIRNKFYKDCTGVLFLEDNNKEDKTILGEGRIIINKLEIHILSQRNMKI